MSQVIKAEPLKSFICRGTRQRNAEDGKLMAMKNTSRAEHGLNVIALKKNKGERDV